MRLLLSISLMVICGCTDFGRDVNVEEEEGSNVIISPTSCSPHLDIYPVNGPHNCGWDKNWNVWTCPPHPADAPDNSDYYTGVGPGHPNGHFGNDIFGKEGTPLVACVSGTIVALGYTNSGGNRVTIKDQCGWYYYYAHMETIQSGLAVGQTVQVGQLLGTLGDTGSAQGTGHHLHFSIYPDGCYTCGIDPFPYLQKVDATSCTGTPTTSCFAEVCNGIDDDCDGEIDEDIPDVECGVGECRTKIPGCKSGQEPICLPKVGATDEICDGKDNDCDGETDEGCDVDKDGYCTISMTCIGTPPVCKKGCLDCNDKDKNINPQATEVCNGIDDNCDGDVDEGMPDRDNDGIADCVDDDDDGDGIKDEADNCPFTPNKDQIDSDNDGSGDVCDGDEDEDGILDDGDSNGILSDHPCQTNQTKGCDDNCRVVRNGEDDLWGAQSDIDNDGVGDRCDPDMDNDGVENAKDNCPRWYNPDQADHDGDGVLGTMANDTYPGQMIVPGINEIYFTGGDACDLDDDNDGILDDGDMSGKEGDYPCQLNMTEKCDDNCKFVKNSKDMIEEGIDPSLCCQSDVDGDGIGDPCDQDMDNDGIPNYSDNCPRWPNKDQSDSDKQWDFLPKEFVFQWNPLYPNMKGQVDKYRISIGGDPCDVDDDNDGFVDSIPTGKVCGKWKDNPACPQGIYVSLKVDAEVSSEHHQCGAWEIEDCQDNCLFVPNGIDEETYQRWRDHGQADHDQDGMGDACDDDDDNDGILDDGNNDGIPSGQWKLRPVRPVDCEHGKVMQIDWQGQQPTQCIGGITTKCDDNCPWVSNMDQADTDGDANPEDDQWGFTPKYQGDEPCDDDDDDDGLLDEDEVRCGTNPKDWDTDKDGYSDFYELAPVGFQEDKDLLYLEYFCCKDEKEDKGKCLSKVRKDLAKEVMRRNCKSPTSKDIFFATDPTWALDSPDHHIAPGAGIGGGGCSAGYKNAYTFVVFSLIVMFILLKRSYYARCQGSWRRGHTS